MFVHFFEHATAVNKQLQVVGLSRREMSYHSVCYHFLFIYQHILVPL